MEENTLISFDNLQVVLEEYGQKVRNEYQDSLIRNNRIASGELLNSVEFRVLQDERSFSVVLDLASYWEYVESDTRPHWPPVDAILKWIQVKPILPRPDSKGRIPSPKSLAFLIGRKISRKGTKGSHDLQQTIQDVNAEYMTKIREAAVKDIENALVTILSRTF